MIQLKPDEYVPECNDNIVTLLYKPYEFKGLDISANNSEVTIYFTPTVFKNAFPKLCGGGK